MISPTLPTMDDIRQEFVWQLNNAKQRGGTVEIIGASFLADGDAIFGEPNADYIARELAWYESMSLNVNDIRGGAPLIWRRVSSKGDGQRLGELRPGTINSNYGFLFYHRENGHQLANVLTALEANRDTRQAVAIYTRPSMHHDWDRDGMHDFVCTNAVHYEIVGSRLNVVVQMRSNDAVFGYRNDWAWQVDAQETVRTALLGKYPDLVAGDIIWQAASLHVYERHFDLIRDFAVTGNWRAPLKQ